MSTQAKSNTFSGDNVPKLTKILFPWSGIFRDACYALIGTFLLQYAITSGVLSSNSADFQAQYGVITIAMMIALLWDGINDPLMGFILEKCHFKAGKFRPWIAIGAIGNAVTVLLMFLVPMFVGQGWGWGYVVFMIIMYVLWDTFFTMNDIGYWSMLPSLTSDAKVRADLTTKTAIAATIGTFVMNIMMFVLPGTFPGSTVIEIYAFTGIGVAVFFLASQLFVYFFCKEKVRDKEQEEVSGNSSILDLFKVVIKNKQLLAAAIGMLLYYFGSYILTGIGQNYFYILYGYGGGKGGMVTTVISVFYVLGTIVAQAFYPVLAKKLKKQTILTIMSAIILVSYIAFFFIAFPVFGSQPLAYNDPNSGGMWFLGGTMFLLYLFAFLFFGASGIFYLVVLVMFQDAIDYNEYKYGERKESICFAWRPLDVKLASGLNRGLQYLVFAITGTVLAINSISNWEGVTNALNNSNAGDEAIKNAIAILQENQIQTGMNNIQSSQLTLFGIIVIGVIVVSFLASYCVLHFGFKIDEKMQKEMAEELEKRHEVNLAKEGKVEEAAA